MLENPRLEKLTQAISKLPEDQIAQIETIIQSMGKKALNLKEAAQMLNVSNDTLRRAIKTGRIRAFRMNKLGNYRISIEEIESFLKGGKNS